MTKLRKGLCSDYNDKSRVDLLVPTDRVVFILIEFHLGFDKCRIIVDSFYFPLIEPIKVILNMHNIRKDPIGDLEIIC